MEITKSTIKALASDTRLEILRILSQRRKIAADLAKMLDLAPSTVNGHLKILEEEGLVKRKETGHKWIYFEITEKGKSLVKPRSPMQFIIILSLGFLMIFFGGFKSFTGAPKLLATQKTESMILGTEEAARSLPASGGTDWLLIFLILVGIFMVLIGAYNIWKLKKAEK